MTSVTALAALRIGASGTVRKYLILHEEKQCIKRSNKDKGIYNVSKDQLCGRGKHVEKELKQKLKKVNAE